MAGKTVGLWFPNNDRRDLRFFVGRTLIGLRWMVICLSFLVSTVQMVAAQSALAPAIPLTAEEQTWLKAHPDITLGYTDVFEPEVITNPDGSHRGILVDFLDELNRRLGTRIRLRIDPIPELLGKAQKRKTDGIVNILPEYADKLGLLKTEGYLTGYGAVFTRKNMVFDRPSDLAGKKVAIVDKVMFTELIVERYGAGATILKVNDALEGLQRVDRGEVDVFLGASINAYFLSKYQLFGLALQYVYYNHPYTGGMAIRPDWPELVTILNKGIASFSKNEIDAIVGKWISVPEPYNPLELTEEERAWLKDNPHISVGFFSVPPYMWVEDGQSKGYLVDMMQSLTKQTEILPEFHVDPLAETLSRVKNGQYHAVLGMIHSKERAGFMYFSEHVMDMQMAIFSRTSRSDISDAAALTNKVIASYKGYGFEPAIKKYLPDAKIIRADDAEGMLKLVASGEADAALQELHSGEFILRDSFINGVNRKGNFDPPDLPAITGSEFGVSKKFPLLNSILNKSYHALPESEKNRVWRKWFADDTERLIKKQIQLTSEEQAWLREHPEIRLAFSADYPPGLIVDEDGNVSGQFKDLIDLLNQRLGTNFGITVAEIKAVREMVANKEVAGQLALTAGNGASRGLLETQVLWETYPVIFAPKDSPKKISALEDLKGKAVSTLKGSRYAEKILAPYQDKIDIVRADTIVEALRLLYEGKVDYMIGLTSQTYYFTKMRFLTLEPAFVMTDRPTKIVMGVRDDWPKLVEILNKGLKSITEDEWVTINDKWLGTPDVIRPQLSLTLEEQAWIDQNHKIRVRVANWPPFLIIKENDPPQGIAIEYLKLVEERTGLKFEYEMAKQSFAEFLESIKLHQGPDMTPLIAQSPDREQYLSFTTPYISSPYVIFARQQEGVLIDINGLSGKTLAVPKGFVIQQLLEKDYPEIRLVLFENDEQSLLALSSGKVDAYIGNLTVASHLIQKRGLSNLRVVAPAPYGDHVLSMGNRNDWPELTTIVDKALASITEAEKTAIRDKYVALRYEPGTEQSDGVKMDPDRLLRCIGRVLFFVIWNRSLASRVRHRTMELENSAESLKTEIAERNRTEAALQKSRRFTDNLIETANVMIVGLDDKGTVNLFNPAAEKITGYTVSELQGKNWFELLVPKERYPQVHLEFSRLMAGGLPKSFQNPILTKNGEERVISWSNNEIKEGDQIAGTLSFGIDITDRSRMEEALQESEEKFRYLVEQSPLSIQVFDLDGRIVQVNEAWKVLWGISEERLPEVFEKYNVLEDEEVRELGVLPLIEKAFKGEGVTLPVIDYDASTTLESLEIGSAEVKKRWVRVQFYPIKNTRGEVVSVVGIEEDITSSIQAEQEILQYQHRLKALASQLTIAEEKERRTIAADLHDHVGHSLALARMQLNGILESDSDLERNILVKDISNIMLQALQDTRSLIFELSSPSMNEIGLGAAISEWLEEQIEKRHGLKTEFSDTIEKEHRKALDDNVRALLFRNVRELLTNVVKHARAKKVSVYLKENANGVTVVIEDDGTGFDPEAVKTRNGKQGGFGLFSIHERMTDLGGTFDIQSSPGRGCRVVLTVPVEKEKR